jgi:hypothetical protein
MAPIVAVVEGDLAEQLQVQWDAVGVLLMIRINAEHRRLMSRRRVPCLDDYLDRVNLLLWPRFKVLWDLQHASIKAGAERSLFTGEVAVAAAVKRYAALTASVLRLMSHHDEEDGERGRALGVGRPVTHSRQPCGASCRMLVCTTTPTACTHRSLPPPRRLQGLCVPGDAGPHVGRRL